MRTVFRHKSYDTETARLIGKHEEVLSEGGDGSQSGSTASARASTSCA